MIRTFKSRFTITLLLLCIFDPGLFSRSLAGDTLRVGVFQNKPIVYFEEGPQGLFVEILNQIAAQEQWQLEYVSCRLADCLEQLSSGQLDLMPSLGVNRERLERFSFNVEPVWTFWGAIYASDTTIRGVFDLKGKRIGVRKRTNTTAALKKILNDFSISVEYVEYDDYETALAHIQQDRLDAVALNNTYAFEKLKGAPLYRTPIVFNPFSAYFAAAKNSSHHEKLAIIDKYVREIKADPSSVMQDFTDRWFGEEHHYWTIEKISIISVLTTICVFAMLLWRYMSMVQLNRELAASIKERQRVEQELRESEACLLEAQDIAKMGRWELDLVTDTLLWSEGIYTLFEVSNDGGIGTYDAFLSYVHPEDRTLVDRAYRNSVENKAPYHIEHRIFTSDGRTKWVSEIGRTEYDEDGNPLRSIGTVQDISERKLAEEEKRNLQNQLMQSQKMESIGTLAGGIAHDFNNILTGIMGYAEMARIGSPADSMVANDLDNVIKAGNRARELVKQILAFSRQSETELVTLQPGRLVAETLKLLRPSLPATIDILPDIDIDAGLILANPTQIHQAVLNLYTNAFHAMEEKGGTLSIAVKKKYFSCKELVNIPSIQPGNFVQITIRDTGQGISPAIREKIFEPYFTTKEVGKGTGMGLAIVHGIIKSCGGFIDCHSQINEGTTFSINVPIVEAQPPPEDKALEQISTGTEHILFIDDEDMLVELGKVMLERLGYRVTVRTSSMEALNTFKNQPDLYDLVITDQTMPGMTGIDVARKMLQIRPMVPIILCTGYSSLISEEKAKSLGIQGFALKPLSMNTVAAIIRKVLDGEKNINTKRLSEKEI